jgi:hypothetical protein
MGIINGLKNKKAPSCGNCFFWNPKKGAENTPHPQPCRRNPPAWRTSAMDPLVWFSAFPETFSDDRCGEWKRQGTSAHHATLTRHQRGKKRMAESSRKVHR